MQTNLISPVIHNSKSHVHLFEKRKRKMNTRISSARKWSNIGIGLLFVLLAVLVLSSCTSKDKITTPSCNINIWKRVSIDVTDANPRVVFDQLARELDCTISVSPFIWKHVTLHVENVPIFEVLGKVYSQIEGKDILYEDHLAVKPLTIMDRIRAKQWEEFTKMMVERKRILQSHLPEGLIFEDVPLSTVLEEISKVSGLKLKPWQDEGDRKVTINVSGMTVDEALKAVVLYVDGEGAVLIEQKYFLHHSYGQYWLWGYPPSY